MDKEYYLVTFKNVNQSIKAENILKENNQEVKIVLLPSEIAASCGYALEIQNKDIDKCYSILKESLEYDKIYSILKNGVTKTFNLYKS